MSLAETKTSPTKISQTSTPSNIDFYSSSFPRPKSIPITVFVASTTSMNEGIESNKYAHWKTSDSNPKPKCKHKMSRHKFDECADCKQKSIPLKQIEKEEKWSNEIKKQDAAHKDHISLLHNCGVKIEWLLAFTFDHNCWNRPTWWVNRHIIKEATQSTRCRYMHLPEMKEYAGPATIFMSHCWGALWGDVVLAACHGARFGRVVWIDLFAVRQWPGSEADLNFRGVINKCKALIVSVSPVDGLKNFMPQGLAGDFDKFLASEEGKLARRRIPVFRLWCNVEIAAAYSSQKSIIVKGGMAKAEKYTFAKWKTTGTFEKCKSWEKNGDGTYNVVFEPQITPQGYYVLNPRDNVPINEMHVKEADGILTYRYDSDCIGKLMSNLAYMVNVESSNASNQEDYDREIAIIRNLEGGVAGVNTLVSGVVNGAIHSIDENILEIEAYVCDEKESFRALNIPSCCKGKERDLALKILRIACAGGRQEIVHELLLKWNTKEEEEEKKSKKKMEWLVKLIDDSEVIWQASNGHVQVLEMLLKVKGINVNVLHGRPDKKFTALSQACTQNHVDVIKLLLQENSIDVNRPDTGNGSTALFYSCQNGHVASTCLLLNDTRVDVHRSRTTDGFSPLHISCQQGHIDVVKRLLGIKDININQTNNEDATPLFLSSMEGHIDIVHLLLQQPDIDINAKTITGLSPLCIASKSGFISVVGLLLGAKGIEVNQDGQPPLYWASYFGHVEIVKLLLGVDGIDVNRPMPNGMSPLYVASQNGNIEVVKLLLQVNDIDINQPSKKNVTPLNMASDQGKIEIVRLLLQQPNIDINKIDDWNDTALSCTIKRNTPTHFDIGTLICNAIQKKKDDGMKLLCELGFEKEQVKIAISHYRESFDYERTLNELLASTQAAQSSITGESKGLGDSSDGSDRSDDDELAMALALSMKK